MLGLQPGFGPGQLGKPAEVNGERVPILWKGGPVLLQQGQFGRCHQKSYLRLLLPGWII